MFLDGPNFKSPPALPPLWQDAPRYLPVLLVATIAGGLWLDATFGHVGQHLTTVFIAAIFLGLCGLGGPTERRVLLLCLVISSLGEVGLSLGWGLYDYQFDNVPLFVPPGHAVLMTIGLLAAPRLSPRAMHAIQGVGAAWALHVWLNGRDEFGALLFLVFGACSLFSRGRQLYAAMFVLSLALELYGTALGNWAWRGIAPGTGLTQANPPFAAGAFYCLLDLLVLAALRRWPVPDPSTAVAPMRTDEA